MIVAAGGGDLQKSISDINSTVAQGANAITVIPDFGQAELAGDPGRRRRPASRSCRGAPTRAASHGTDYVGYVDWNTRYAGTCGRNWMVKLLHGKGNIIYPAARPATRSAPAQLKSIVKVFAKHPGMKLLTGNKTWPVTNWDPATAQKR